MAAQNRVIRVVRTLLKGVLKGVVTVAAVYAAALFLLMIFGIKPYIVISGSMEPDIRTGSLCLVNSRVAFDSIVEGDVIAFETAGGGMVTHRVVGIYDQKMETKGDANDVSDGCTTTPDNFRGKTLFSVPYLGYLNYAVGRKGGKMVCLILIFLLLGMERGENCRNDGGN